MYNKIIVTKNYNKKYLYIKFNKKNQIISFFIFYGFILIISCMLILVRS
jgi:hypothetical protein